MPKTIIGITGLARSGKDTVADYIAEKYSFKVFTMSDTLRSECMKRNLEITKDNLSLIGDAMRKEFGNDIVAVKTIEKAGHFPRSIITGVRSPEEIDVFKDHCPGFILLTVEAPDSSRFGRRTEKDLDTESGFFSRDERDMKNKGMGDVIEMADQAIKNDSTLEELYRKVDRFIDSISL
ncbi:MAG: AAA family ATPase [Candidatus Aenigmarchaeota archaeon]|nr:AAA family ATPase [Candidatus Aenigmarchaeota archaeon]